jgi:hypothetical protein
MKTTLAATSSPFLSADGLLNLDAIKALGDETKKIVKGGAKPEQIIVASRKVKGVKYSAKEEKAENFKYIVKRAFKVASRKRLTDKSLGSVQVLFYVPAAADMDKKLAAKVKNALAAVKSHATKAEKLKETVKKKKGKIRDVANKEFGKNIEIVKKLLLGTGIKEKDMVLASSMFGQSLLVKIAGDAVISIGKSDLDKFKAAVKQAKAAAAE